MPNRNLYATLTGINAYPENELGGCIRDVINMDLLLRQFCNQHESGSLTYRPLYLLAPHFSDKQCIQEYQQNQKVSFEYDEPTFSNISTKAFDHLGRSKDGDICLFYYSGHGSQVEAPPGFRHMKSNGLNETIVCVDSRDSANPEARDLIDKELAYLLWKTFKGRDLHSVVIMDCCHSGNNTRAVIPDDIKYRFVPSQKNQVPIEEYLGYTEGFYKEYNNEVRFDIARYVHLAAAGESEQSVETMGGGLFTSKLIAELRSGGITKSYRDLIQDLSTIVNNRSEKQHPVAFAINDDDLDKSFLGNNLVSFRANYIISYDKKNARWRMSGGAMHGIFPSGKNRKTIVREEGSRREIEIIKVYGSYSIPDPKAMAEFDCETDYSAVLIQLASPALIAGFSTEFAGQTAEKNKLINAFEALQPLYVQMISENSAEADFLIRLTSDRKYILTRRDSTQSLFKQKSLESNFVKSMNAVGKWMFVSEIQNKESIFSKENFNFEMEIIEAQSLKPVGIMDTLNGKKLFVRPGDEIGLHYYEDLQPAFRFSMGLNDTAGVDGFYAGVLYLDSLYGISTELTGNDIGLIGKNERLSMKIKGKENFYKTIPVTLDKSYAPNGMNEATDIIKVFISDSPVNLERYKQKPLVLDELRTRGTGWMEEVPDNKGNWTVFDFRIRIAGAGMKK